MLSWPRDKPCRPCWPGRTVYMSFWPDDLGPVYLIGWHSQRNLTCWPDLLTWPGKPDHLPDLLTCSAESKWSPPADLYGWLIEKNSTRWDIFYYRYIFNRIQSNIVFKRFLGPNSSKQAWFNFYSIWQTQKMTNLWRKMNATRYLQEQKKLWLVNEWFITNYARLES